MARRENPYDAMVLDVMLPRLSGDELCARLRPAGNWTPILMLTARSAAEEEARALDAGADDFLAKPFSYVVLLARLRALLRRGGAERPTVLRPATCALDPAAHVVRRGETADRADAAPVLAAGAPDAPRRRGACRRRRSSSTSGTSPTRATPTSSRSTSASCGSASTSRSGAASLQTVRLVGYRLDPDGG